MKAGKEHQVALSKAAMRVLHKVRAITEGIGGAVGASALVFPNDRTGGQLSEAALSSILSRMKFDGITVHGFRSAFRDWAGEESHFRVTLPKWHWRIRSAIRPNEPIAVRPFQQTPLTGGSMGRLLFEAARCKRWQGAGV
jgi:integrase